MTLKTKVSGADYEALDKSIQQFYVKDGEGYKLDSDAEDVEGLKKSKADILKEKKALEDQIAELAKFKADKEAEANKAEEEKAKKAGEFEKVLEQKEKAWKERLDALTTDKDSLFADVKRERLTNELIKRGVLPDRANYLVSELDADIELTKDDSGKYTIKKKGGIGDAAEFDAMINEAKTAKPFFFAANGASGSGASGSQQSGGNAKTMPESQFDALSPQEQAAFINSGGSPV